MLLKAPTSVASCTEYVHGESVLIALHRVNIDNYADIVLNLPFNIFPWNGNLVLEWDENVSAWMGFYY